MNNTNSHTVAQKRRREYGADTHRDAEGVGKFFRRRSQVRDVNRLAIDDRATGRRTAIEDPDLTQTNNHGDGSKVRRAAQQVAVDAQDRDIFSVAEFRRPLGDAVEHHWISAGARAIIRRTSPVAASRSSDVSRSRTKLLVLPVELRDRWPRRRAPASCRALLGRHPLPTH